MRLSFSKKILFTFIIVLATLLILEGIVRALDFFIHREDLLKSITMAVPSENRIFELKPNYAQRIYSDEYSTQAHTNSLGLREREVPLQKPPRTVRIIALGDSHTFGMGVEDNERWSNVLENMLNGQQNVLGSLCTVTSCERTARARLSNRYEVINLGSWGYTFDQQLLRLKEKGLSFHPDLVIQGVNWAHLKTIATHEWTRNQDGSLAAIHDPHAYVDSRGVLRQTEEIGWLAFLRRHSRLLDIVVSKIKTAFLYHEVVNEDLAYLYPENYTKMESQWNKMFDILKETRDLLQRQHINYVVFLIPRDVQVSREEWNQSLYKDMNDKLLQEKFPQKVMSAFFKKENIASLDLLPIFKQRYEKDLFFPVDVHLTKKGHILAAQSIFEFIEKKYPRFLQLQVGN